MKNGNNEPVMALSKVIKLLQIATDERMLELINKGACTARELKRVLTAYAPTEVDDRIMIRLSKEVLPSKQNAGSFSRKKMSPVGEPTQVEKDLAGIVQEGSQIERVYRYVERIDGGVTSGDVARALDIDNKSASRSLHCLFRKDLLSKSRLKKSERKLRGPMVRWRAA